MVNAASEFSFFLQRREHLAHESRSARSVYAYGVDLRRSAWLDHSSVGEALMRSVDRQWSGLVEELNAEVLQPEDQSPPLSVMQRLYRLIDMLRCPRPSVRLLRGDADPDHWPIATPLGTTQGSAHLLVLDVPRLESLPASESMFVLSSALSHLQCDHGPLLTAHLLAHRGRRGARLLRHLLAPWARVSSFSADRAALLVSGNLEETSEAIATVGTPNAPWWPKMPTLKLRLDALSDFDKSRVMTRVRMSREDKAAAEEDESSAKTTEEPSSPEKREDAAVPDDGEGDDDRDPVRQAEQEAERIVEATEAAEAAQEREAQQRRHHERLRQAWSLARCDQRLTRRLGLL